ncbi:hypothetical protein ABKN59_004794 [Abortiporus biennis]
MASEEPTQPNISENDGSEEKENFVSAEPVSEQPVQPAEQISEAPSGDTVPTQTTPDDEEGVLSESESGPEDTSTVGWKPRGRPVKQTQGGNVKPRPK